MKLNRIGGGFGGKETRNINFSCIAAIAANKLNRPVRLTLPRDIDMTITGYASDGNNQCSGRHPFRGEYKVGFTNQGMIKAADIKLYQEMGRRSKILAQKKKFLLKTQNFNSKKQNLTQKQNFGSEKQILASENLFF